MEGTNTSYVCIKYSIDSVYSIYCNVLFQPEMSGHSCKIPVLNDLLGMWSCDKMIKFTASQ